MAPRLKRPEDPSVSVTWSLRQSHMDTLTELAERLLQATGVKFTRARLMQFAIEQLEHHPNIARALAGTEPLEKL